MSTRYPISTLAQIAEIPEEALPRFLAELPKILIEMRKAAPLMAAMQALAGDDIEFVEFGPEWVNDDLDMFGVRISTTEGEDLFSASAKRA